MRLWGVVYGIWDHIKNSGAFDAETLTLDWVGAIPGKREYRRFIGDHTLTQQDLLSQRTFPDAVAFGGWSIDLHPVEGVYAETAGAQQRYTDGTYDIPFRSLYSADVANLLFAGRNISASHVAFGSTRVMATCATQGQAAGTAAHLVARHGTTPRTLGADHVEMLQQTLLREDAPLIGVRAVDGADQARRATITASSELTSIDTTPWATADTFALDRDVAIVLPADPALGSFALRTVADDDGTAAEPHDRASGRPASRRTTPRSSTSPPTPLRWLPDPGKRWWTSRSDPESRATRSSSSVVPPASAWS